MMKMIPVLALEFQEGGDTLWVHGLGGTVLRIKTMGGKITSKRCELSPVSHADIMIKGDVEICVAGPESLERRYLDKVDTVVKEMLEEECGGKKR